MESALQLLPKHKSFYDNVAWFLRPAVAVAQADWPGRFHLLIGIWLITLPRPTQFRYNQPACCDGRENSRKTEAANRLILSPQHEAEVAELADALGSGPSGLTMPVEVQVLSSALLRRTYGSTA